MRNGKPLVSFVASWYCGRDLDPAWELRQTGWRLLVDGDTPLDVSITFPVPAERWAAVSPGLTAHRAVNAIPAACEAAPGIRTTLDLPNVVAQLGGSE
jgi:4-hydroxy-tetrahydrodipicolinate reductase